MYTDVRHTDCHYSFTCLLLTDDVRTFSVYYREYDFRMLLTILLFRILRRTGKVHCVDDLRTDPYHHYTWVRAPSEAAMTTDKALTIRYPAGRGGGGGGGGGGGRL